MNVYLVGATYYNTKIDSFDSIPDWVVQSICSNPEVALEHAKELDNEERFAWYAGPIPLDMAAPLEKITEIDGNWPGAKVYNSKGEEIA